MAKPPRAGLPPFTPPSTPPSTSPPQRKGAKRISEIPGPLLLQISRGQIPTVTLVEMLAADFGELLRCISPSLPAAEVERVQSAGGITRKFAVGAHVLSMHNNANFADGLRTHPSDLIRGIACFMMAQRTDVSLTTLLNSLRPLADDPHSGVREWAWLAARPILAGNLGESIQSLIPWTAESSPNLRRFASEATRPRGVWCSHISELKQHPELGLPLLNPLRRDPAKYVQDSVGNWLNDASKSNPQWVTELCEKWQREAPSSATSRICQRALRTVNKG